MAKKEKTVARKISIFNESFRRRMRRDILARKIKLERSFEYKRLKRIRRKYVPPYRHCKNCGTELKGMYCHNCGQYALDSRQPFWKYLLQYFENVYQFDTKIWSTLWLLFRRPGFLTNEFNAGKIASYVHPMRLFMCITLLFFIYFFFMLNDKVDNALEDTVQSATIIDELEASPDNSDVAVAADALSGVLEKDTVVSLIADISVLEKYPEIFQIVESGRAEGRHSGEDTVKVRMSSVFLDDFEHIGVWHGTGLYGDNDVDKGEITLFKDGVIGTLSSYAPLYALLLVPVMGFLLKLLYRRKHRRYMEHLAYSLHWGSFFYIMTALFIMAGELWQYAGVPAWSFLILTVLYTVVSLHRVYSNGWFKTVLKSLILIFTYFFIILVISSIVFVLVLYSQQGVLE